MRFLWLLTCFIGTIFFQLNNASACSLVLMNDKGPAVMVGRNMDWFEAMQTKLMVYPRGMLRIGYDPTLPSNENALRWHSQYGSLIAMSYDDGVADGLSAAADGMNEGGLAAHLLVLEGANYGVDNGTKPTLSILFWAQYYLDNFKSVNEAVAFTREDKIQILPFYSPKLRRYINLHLALEDSSGDSAVIEYVEGKPVIYHGEENKVMTNEPFYNQQLANLKQYKGFGGDKPLPGTSHSSDRFVRAAYYATYIPKASTLDIEITRLLSIMQNVAGILDESAPRPGYTLWHTVTDLTNRLYYFKSTSQFGLIWVALQKFDLSPGAPVLQFDTDEPTPLMGDVSELMSPVAAKERVQD